MLLFAIESVLFASYTPGHQYAEHDSQTTYYSPHSHKGDAISPCFLLFLITSHHHIWFRTEKRSKFDKYITERRGTEQFYLVQFVRNGNKVALSVFLVFYDLGSSSPNYRYIKSWKFCLGVSCERWMSVCEMFCGRYKGCFFLDLDPGVTMLVKNYVTHLICEEEGIQ